ncbi:ATP phosphoribosyltransferase [Dermabacteraceae bacterium P13115]
MLRIAVPNKGALSEPATALLKDAGYRQRASHRELVLVDEANGVEFFFLRPRDIAVYVGSGTVDAGITGQDMLLDSGTAANELLALGFARSTFRFAGPNGQFSDVSEVADKRIATSYGRLVEDFLGKRGMSARVVHLDGAVESAIRLGVADLIADVVETGSTLRAAGLAPFGEPLMHSEAVLFASPDAKLDGEAQHTLEILISRLKSVLVARRYVLLDYDVSAADLERAVALTPGFESPTVAPLHGSDWYAVRAMVERDCAHRVMDELYAVGARAILVTAIQACRI